MWGFTAGFIICVCSFQSSSGNVGVTVKREISGLHGGMDNKENKNKDQGSVGMQIKGPMDSYVISLKNKTVSSGQFLTVSDSGCNGKSGTLLTPEPGMGCHVCVCVYVCMLLNKFFLYELSQDRTNIQNQRSLRGFHCSIQCNCHIQGDRRESDSFQKKSTR